MSEKEIIEEIKKYLDYKKDVSIDTLENLLNLYTKQKEENKQLKNKNENLQKEIKIMKSINVNDFMIAKDKIRNKIKELDILLEEN